jgi:hypothetical protein
MNRRQSRRDAINRRQSRRDAINRRLYKRLIIVETAIDRVFMMIDRVFMMIDRVFMMIDRYSHKLKYQSCVFKRCLKSLIYQPLRHI